MILNVLNDQVIPSTDFLFPDGSGIFQDDNAKIHQALVVKQGNMRTHEACQGAWGLIFTHELATTESWLQPHWKSLGCAGKNGLTLLSSIQNLGQKWMQLWMEINVVTLHKVVETMPQLRNQSKRRSNEILECATFFLARQFIWTCLGAFIWNSLEPTSVWDCKKHSIWFLYSVFVLTLKYDMILVYDISGITDYLLQFIQFHFIFKGANYL